MAEIQRNEWKTPNQNLQINYDNTAFEVVDKYNIPVLQIEFYDSKTLILGGMLYFDDKLLILYDNGFIEIPKISTFFESEITKRDFIRLLKTYIPFMTKIFKYVGNNWEGIRNLNRKISKPMMNIMSVEVKTF